MRNVSEEQLKKWIELIQDKNKNPYQILGYLERELERLLKDIHCKSC